MYIKPGKYVNLMETNTRLSAWQHTIKLHRKRHVAVLHGDDKL